MARAEAINDQSGQMHGWIVYCPACETHHVFDARWKFNGNVERPTFTPSMLVYEHDYGNGKRPRCHSFVTDGSIIYLTDCTHALAGKTVELPEID